MSMTVDCPSCQKKLRVSEEFLGKKMRCAACQQVFEVPSTPPPSDDPPPRYEPYRGNDEPMLPPRPAPRDHDSYDRPPLRPVRDEYEDRRGRYDDDYDRPRRRDEDYDDPRYGRRSAYLTPTTCGDANTALWMGIVGVLCCQLISPIALIYGIKALSQINNSNGGLTGTGQAIAGIVLGVLGMGLLAIGLLARMAEG